MTSMKITFNGTPEQSHLFLQAFNRTKREVVGAVLPGLTEDCTARMCGSEIIVTTPSLSVDAARALTDEYDSLAHPNRDHSAEVYAGLDTSEWLPGVYPRGYGARRVGKCGTNDHNDRHFEDPATCYHWVPLTVEEASEGDIVVLPPRVGSLKRGISVDSDENISVHHGLDECIWWDHATQGWARNTDCSGRMSSVTVGSMHTHGNDQTVLVCEAHLNAPGNPYHH